MRGRLFSSLTYHLLMLNLDYFRMLSMMFIWGLVSDSRRQRRRVVISVVIGVIVIVGSASPSPPLHVCGRNSIVNLSNENNGMERRC